MCYLAHFSYKKQRRPLLATWAKVAAPTLPTASVREPMLLFVTEKGFTQVYDFFCLFAKISNASQKMNLPYSIRTYVLNENIDFTVFKYFSKTHCASKNWPIWTQKVPKEAYTFKLPTFVRFCSKIFCCTWTKIRSVHTLDVLFW